MCCVPTFRLRGENGFELYFSKAFENVMSYVNGNPANITILKY